MNPEPDLKAHLRRRSTPDLHNSSWAGICAVLVAALLALTWPSPARPQPFDSPAAGTSGGNAARFTAPREAQPSPEAAPVIIDGHLLFRLRGLSAFPAAQRANGVRDRIRSIARDERFAPEDLRVVQEGSLFMIMADGERVLGLADADAVTEGIDLDLGVLAELYRNRIAEAIRMFRADRQPEVLLIRTGYALGVTLLLVLGLLLVSRVLRRLRAFSEREFRERVGMFQIQGFRLIHAENLWQALATILRAGWIVILLTALYFYLQYVLTLYPWTRRLGNSLLDFVLGPLRTMWTGFVDTIPDLVFIVILIVITRYALKLIRLFFSAVENNAVTIEGFDRTWAQPTSKIIRLLVIVFALVMAYPYIPGSDSAAFQGISILLGVIFSLGSTSVIANVIAGYTMAFRRAFRIGDRIRVDELIGDVMEMRVLVTRLRSLKNEEVVIPNSIILNSSIVNYSSMAKRDNLILHTTVGIGYEVPWRQVEAMLIESANRTSGLLRDPPPFILQRSLGDFAINYELNAYTDDAAGMYWLYSEVHRNILDVFNEYGVQIMTPNYESDPPEAKLVPREQWYVPPASPPVGSFERDGADDAS